MITSISTRTHEAARRTMRIFAVLSLSTVYVAAQITNTAASAKRVAVARVEQARDDAERGEISSTTVIIAILVLLAVAVGGIITTKITDTANSIETQ